MNWIRNFIIRFVCLLLSLCDKTFKALKVLCVFLTVVVIGARQAGLSISETTDLLGLLQGTVSRVFTENDSKKRKYQVSGSSLGKNALSAVRGE